MAPASCILAPAAAAFSRARRAKWPSAAGGGSSPSGSHATPAEQIMEAVRFRQQQGGMAASMDSGARPGACL